MSDRKYVSARRSIDTSTIQKTPNFFTNIPSEDFMEVEISDNYPKFAHDPIYPQQNDWQKFNQLLSKSIITYTQNNNLSFPQNKKVEVNIAHNNTQFAVYVNFI